MVIRTGRALAAAILLALAACRDGGGASPRSAGSPPPPAPAPAPDGTPPLPLWAVFEIVVGEFDPVDYAVWMQWQDGDGFIQSEFLLPSDPGGTGPGTDSQVFVAAPGTIYWLALTDASGLVVFDTVGLGVLTAGETSVRQFVQVGATLVPL